MKQFLTESLPSLGEHISFSTMERSILLEGPPAICVEIDKQSVARCKIQQVTTSSVGEGMDFRGSEIRCFRLETNLPFENDLLTQAYCSQQGLDPCTPTLLAYRENYSLYWTCAWDFTRIEAQDLISYVCLVDSKGGILDCLACIKGEDKSNVDLKVESLCQGAALTYRGPYKVVAVNHLQLDCTPHREFVV